MSSGKTKDKPPWTEVSGELLSMAASGVLSPSVPRYQPHYRWTVRHSCSGHQVCSLHLLQKIDLTSLNWIQILTLLHIRSLLSVVLNIDAAAWNRDRRNVFICSTHLVDSHKLKIKPPDGLNIPAVVFQSVLKGMRMNSLVLMQWKALIVIIIKKSSCGREEW